MQNFRDIKNNQPLLPDDILVKREKLRKASDTNTLPEVLDELADFPDFIVQQAVAKNSNTPLPTLIKLSGVGINVHKHPAILRTHVQISAKGHPFLNSDLISDPDPYIASQKLRNFLIFASDPEANMDTLRILAKHPNEKVVAALLKNKSITPEFLFSLCEHPSSYVRTLIAKHPKSTSELLSKMVINSQLKKQAPERAIIAINHKCPAQALTSLANDQSVWVRRNVARNNNCPVDVLSRLAFDENSLVRSSVLKHKQTPLYILTRMASDADPNIKAALARREDMPGKVLERLAVDTNENVRLKVAENPNTSTIILDRLSGDSSLKVRKAVIKNSNASQYAIERARSFGTTPDQQFNFNIKNVF